MNEHVAERKGIELKKDEPKKPHVCCGRGNCKGVCGGPDCKCLRKLKS